MNTTNSNGIPFGATARSVRSPYRGVHDTPGLNALLDTAFGPLTGVQSRPLPVAEERVAELLDELNSMVHTTFYGTDTAIMHGVARRVGASDVEVNWDSQEFLTFIRKQPEFAGAELVAGEPIEFFLHDGQVLVWSVDVYAWELAVDTVATFAGAGAL